MVLFWINNLSPTENSSSACAELDAYILARPPQSDSFTNVNIAFSIITGLLLLVTMVWWILLMNEPRMLSRPFISTLFISVAFFLQIWVTCIRRSVLDSNGHPTMPCHLHALLWLLIGPLFSIATFLRMVYMANRVRFTEILVSRRKLDFGSDASSDNGPESTALTPPANLLFLRKKNFTRLFRTMLGYTERLKTNTTSPAASDARVSNVSGPRSNSLADAAHDHQLSTLLAASRTEAFWKLFLVWVTPNLIIAIVLFVSFPVYRAPCMGCDISFELLIAMNLSTPITIWAGSRVQNLLVHDADPDGIMFEMKLTQRCGALVFMVLCWFLLGFDPNLHDYQNRVAWEWLNAFGIFMIWFILVPLQLFLTQREKLRREKIQIKRQGISQRFPKYSNESVFTVLKDPKFGPEFEAFAVKELVLESVRFLQDTATWKGLFQEKSDSWKVSKAKIILDTYILTGAPLEVNISSWEKEQVEKGFKVRPLSSNLFDPAIESVATMLRQGALLRFLHSKQDNISDGSIAIHSSMV